MAKEITKEIASSIYHTYEKDLYNIALMITRSKILAEDAVSETFIKVFQYYSKYDENRPLKPWLTKILINCIHQEFRKNKRWFLIENVPDEEDTHNFAEHYFSKEEEKVLWSMMLPRCSFRLN